MDWPSGYNADELSLSKMWVLVNFPLILHSEILNSHVSKITACLNASNDERTLIQSYYMWPSTTKSTSYRPSLIWDNEQNIV